MAGASSGETNYIRSRTCPTCGRLFASVQTRQRHERRHSANQPRFPCTWPDCGRDFAREDTMHAHVQAVHRHIIHRCTVQGCGYESPRPDRLREHIANVHGPQQPRDSTAQSLPPPPPPPPSTGGASMLEGPVQLDSRDLLLFADIPSSEDSDVHDGEESEVHDEEEEEEDDESGESDPIPTVLGVLCGVNDPELTSDTSAFAQNELTAQDFFILTRLFDATYMEMCRQDVKTSAAALESLEQLADTSLKHRLICWEKNADEFIITLCLHWFYNLDAPPRSEQSNAVLLDAFESSVNAIVGRIRVAALRFLLSFCARLGYPQEFPIYLPGEFVRAVALQTHGAPSLYAQTIEHVDLFSADDGLSDLFDIFSPPTVLPSTYMMAASLYLVLVNDGILTRDDDLAQSRIQPLAAIPSLTLLMRCIILAAREDKHEHRLQVLQQRFQAKLRVIVLTPGAREIILASMASNLSDNLDGLNPKVMRKVQSVRFQLVAALSEAGGQMAVARTSSSSSSLSVLPSRLVVTSGTLEGWASVVQSLVDCTLYGPAERLGEDLRMRGDRDPVGMGHLRYVMGENLRMRRRFERRLGAQGNPFVVTSPDSILRCYEDSFESLSDISADPRVPLLRAWVHLGLARMYIEEDMFNHAETYLQQATAIRKKLLPPGHYLIVQCDFVRVDLLFRLCKASVNALNAGVPDGSHFDSIIRVLQTAKWILRNTALSWRGDRLYAYVASAHSLMSEILTLWSQLHEMSAKTIPNQDLLRKRRHMQRAAAKMALAIKYLTYSQDARRELFGDEHRGYQLAKPVLESMRIEAISLRDALSLLG